MHTLVFKWSDAWRWNKLSTSSAYKQKKITFAQQIFSFQVFVFCVLQSADYGFLLANYKPIAKILTDKLKVLRDLSFDSAEAFIFGFSYGARIVTTAGIDFGPKQIGTIHCKTFSLFLFTVCITSSLKCSIKSFRICDNARAWVWFMYKF